MLIVLLILLVIAAGGVASIYYLGWFGLLVWMGVVFVASMALRSLAGRVLGGGTGMAMALLQAKSGGLRGATFRVNDVTAAPPPERKDGPEGLELDDVAPEARQNDVELTEEEKAEYRAEAEELRADDAKRRWHWIDLTIIPSGSSREGSFQHWDADDLRFVPRGTPPLEAGQPEDDDPEETCAIAEIQAWDGEGFVEAESVDYEGQQRLRLHVGVKPGHREIELRYWFERLGPVDLGNA